MRYLIRTADLEKVSMGDDAIQYITDSMANSLLIKIEYTDSGFRTVQPYGWNNSKDNNLLVMCYKEDGSIRSYRFDRILQLFVDNSLLNAETGVDVQEVDNTDESKNNPTDYIIPFLPETDEILELSESEKGENEPFNDAVDTLEQSINDNTDYVDEHQQDLVNEINDKQEKESDNNDSSDETPDFDLDNTDTSVEENNDIEKDSEEKKDGEEGK